MAEVKTAKIRVLRIIARMNIGGPAIQVTTLMNYIPTDEVNQILVTGECEDGEADYLEFNQIGLKRTIIPGLGRSINPLSDLKAMLTIRKIIKDFRPDILHTHTFKAGLLGRVAALSVLKRPYMVHTFHGHLLQGYLGGLKLRILKTIERVLAAKTDVLVSVGEKVMNDLIQVGVGNRDKFEVIPPGFPITESTSDKRAVSSSSSRNLKCAWIGRIVDVKAPERVLEIARYFTRSDSGVEFLIAGDGPFRDQIQKQSELESLPITFIGWTGDVQKLLREVDLLILTSVNEGTPVSIIEAQRMGIPVVSTDVGSVREIVSNEKSGFVIDYEPSRFAELIKSFATDRDKLKNFSIEALRFSGNKFAPERLAADHLRIYKSLASK